MKNTIDRSIKTVGTSNRAMLGAVLLISGLAIMIAVITSPFAIGVENYSEDGRLLISILPWLAMIEISLGLLILVGLKRRNQ